MLRHSAWFSHACSTLGTLWRGRDRRRAMHAVGAALVGLVTLAVPTTSHAIGVECGTTQSFTSSLGGWGAWWSGNAPVLETTIGAGDGKSMKLSAAAGTATVTATRNIAPSECPFGTRYVSFYARTASGTATVYVKFVDQVTGVTLYDAINGGAVTIGTTWKKISVPITITNSTLMGIASVHATSSPAPVTYIDTVQLYTEACSSQSFAGSTGGWLPWWAGNAPTKVATGRTDGGALKISGSPHGTAYRDIMRTECTPTVTKVSYYARAETGSAYVHTKFYDQVTGVTLYDSLNTGPIAVTSTAWTPITVNVTLTNTTLMGIAVQSQSGSGAVSVLIDDVMLNPAVAAPNAQIANVTPPATLPGGWTRQWWDDFSTSSLDTSKWTAVTTGTTYANSTLGFGDTFGGECYTASQVTVSGGHLRLTAKSQAATCLFQGSVTNKSYVSGFVTTKDKFSQKYGRFEARIKAPVAKGSWPAFWMLPQTQQAYGTCNGGNPGWPCTGEIDILEYVGNINGATTATEPSTMYSTLHWGNSAGADLGGDLGGQYSVQPSVDRWTVYAVEWDATGLSFFVDGALMKKMGPPYANTTIYSADQPFNVPFYMILNQALGRPAPAAESDSWPGRPEAAAYPNTMLVDYVAVYTKP